MNIILVSPARTCLDGNRITALRYRSLLRSLGHAVTLLPSYDDRPGDLLVALHARRSAASIARFREKRPGAPIVLVLTGTDLYRDIRRVRAARVALASADALVVLQRHGVDQLPPRHRKKAHIIPQSAELPRVRARPPQRFFKVCLVANLRPEKDPFRAALAVRLLPETSRIRVVHIGTALRPGMEVRAEREHARNSRYLWMGGLPHWKTLRHLRGSHLVVVTSTLEGGSNVLVEALALSIPVIATNIPSLTSTLGGRHPGLFEPGNTRALARLLRRAETEKAFYERLARISRRLSGSVKPERERSRWRAVLETLPVRSGK